MKNSNLNKAKYIKNDEFYTLYSDIENELTHYKKHFKNKVVLCNCDSPKHSNFWKYFYNNFEKLGLKKIISTHYDYNNTTFKIEYGGPGSYAITNLIGNGDFRSEECIEVLKMADIVVTNPPFSLFREFAVQLVKYNKSFLIIGNLHAITYKEFFPLIQNNKVWCGFNNVTSFIEINGTLKKFGNTLWYTNLDHTKRYKELELNKKFNSEDYPHYDNYDAIEVGKVKDIPMDYTGIIGVPSSFLEKYCPKQFDIVGKSSSINNKDSLNLGVDYSKYIGYRQDGTKTGRTGSTFGDCVVFKKNDGKHDYYTDGICTVQAGNKRLFIKFSKEYVEKHQKQFN